MSKKNIGILATIPHSGEKVPAEATWLQGLPEVLLMCDVDRFIDRLYEPALQKLQLPFVKTEWHRYAADLNRVPEDIDSDSVLGSTVAPGTNARGFHWVVTTKNERLMPQPMGLETHKKLAQLIYEPFHQSVRNLYQNVKSTGVQEVLHLDLHSMPSLGTKQHRDPGERRADIVVSDCSGKSAKAPLVDLVITSFVRAGFKVAYNWPYLGGRVSEQYGQPEKGHHAIQIELNRGLYMDEETKQLRTETLAQIQPKLQRALTLVVDHLN